MFNQKKFVITGAGGGLGQEMTLQLLARGARVIATDIRLESMEPLVQSASDNQWKLEVRKVDVLKSAQLNQLAKSVYQHYGRIDYWINNAGIAINTCFNKMSPEDFQKVFDVNFHAVVHGTRAALKVMEHQGSGAIVNLASVAGHVCPPMMSAYAAAKHAVVGFSRSLQEELRLNDSGVRLVLVSPGFVDTPLINKGKTLGFPKWLSWMLAKPETTVREILKGLERGSVEIFPTLNGRTILNANKLFPTLTRRSAKVLLTHSWKDVLLNRYDAP